MLDSILTFLFGSKRDRDVKQLLPVVEKINQKEDWAKSLKPEDFPLQTAEFKKRLAKGETLNDIQEKMYQKNKFFMNSNTNDCGYGCNN